MIRIIVKDGTHIVVKDASDQCSVTLDPDKTLNLKLYKTYEGRNTKLFLTHTAHDGKFKDWMGLFDGHGYFESEGHRGVTGIRIKSRSPEEDITLEVEAA